MLRKKDLEKQNSFKFIDDGWFALTWEYKLEWDDTGCLFSSVCEVNGETFPIKYIKDFEDLQDTFAIESGFELEVI